MTKHTRLRSPLAVWVAIGVGLALTSQLAFDYFWVLALAPLLLWLGAGLVLVAAPVARSFRSADRTALLRTAAIRLGIVVASIALAWPLARIGASATMHARFALHHATYDRVVDELRAHPPARSGLVREHRAEVDLGPPLRVAFIWPGGVTDNWCGVVYDPTLRVLESNAFDGNWDAWSDQVPTEIRKLFGGDLLACQALSPPYFHCCFT